jgi:hypothetical protein
MAAVTHAELLELVYRFYPRGLYPDGLGYEATEESRRQRDAVRRAVAQAPTWHAMLDRLEARYGPPMDQSGHLLSGRYDPAYFAEILIPGHSLGFCVCVLGPYYGIRRRGAAGEEAAALDLAREIEAAYPGYQPIPPELGDEVVPDVAFDATSFGHATIYHCLLSELWSSLSGPWPPPPDPPFAPPEVPRRGSVLDRGDDPHGEGEPCADAPVDDDPTRSR